jgi:hypothetical protein
VYEEVFLLLVRKMTQKSNNVKVKVKKVKLSHYTPWRHMGGEEV